MRSSGAKRWLLSLGRHAVAEQGAAAAAAAATAEAGPSSAGLLPRGGGLLMRQLRAASSGKASPATASAAGAAADGKTAVQRQERAFSAVPAPRKVDRPWHRRQDEKELGNLAEQRVRGPAANGATGEGRLGWMGRNPKHTPTSHPAAEQQQQQQVGRGLRNGSRPEFVKPRFLLERLQQQEGGAARPAGTQQGTAPQQSQQRPQWQQRQPWREQPQRPQQSAPRGRGGRVNGEAQPSSSAADQPRAQFTRERQQQQPRSQQQQQDRREPGRQQQQHQRQRQPRQAAQAPMTWWQKQRAEKAQDAAAQQAPAAGARGQQQRQQQQQVLMEAGPEEVHIPAEVSVIRLAGLLGTTVEELEPVLRDLGEAPSSEQDIVSPDAAELAALELGKVALVARDGASLDADAVPRPAVVTVMGHVDHGKTTLLDALRSTSVAAHEAGGITQHIGAFEVCMPASGSSLTFLDTPGHAAFSSMRARGAAVTDLVVLVVAADDGVMPQTLEALAHARAAGCPVVVAITKCDMPNANPARVRQQLMGRGVELEEAGGSVQVVEVAAPTRQGLPELEEALLLQAELLELKASRSRRGEGVVIEAKMDKGVGPVATVVVKRGTLQVGQSVVVGCEWGKVRSLRGAGGAAVEEVLPGQPAEISGLKGLPQAGDELLVVANEERAQRMSRSRTAKSEFHRRAAIARLVAASQAAAGEESGEAEAGVKALPLVIKADVQGSAEALRDAVANLSSEQVRVSIAHVGVGPISQSDVQLAVPLGAKIVGFNVRPSSDVEALAKQHGVDIRCQRVIYSLLEEVGEMLVGVAPRVAHEVVVGAAEVLQIFQLKGARGKTTAVVAGCRVTEGSIRGSLQYRVLRGGEVVHSGRCSSLKRHKLDVETVGKGTECGVGLDGFDGFMLGDVIQCVDVQMRPAELRSAA